MRLHGSTNIDYLIRSLLYTANNDNIIYTTVSRVNYGMSATWRSRELTVPTSGAVTMATAGREACGRFFSIYRRVWI